MCMCRRIRPWGKWVRKASRAIESSKTTSKRYMYGLGLGSFIPTSFINPYVKVIFLIATCNLGIRIYQSSLAFLVTAEQTAVLTFGGHPKISPWCQY